MNQAIAPRRSTTDILYGVLDLLVAGMYTYVFTSLVPSRAPAFTIVALALCALLAAGGLGMFAGGTRGRWVATLACLVMLAVCGLVIVLLVSSAAYLHGIYDGVGQAGAAIGLLLAFLAIELVGLLPGLQLAHLLRTRNQGAR